MRLKIVKVQYATRGQKTSLVQHQEILSLLLSFLQMQITKKMHTFQPCQKPFFLQEKVREN